MIVHTTHRILFPPFPTLYALVTFHTFVLCISHNMLTIFRANHKAMMSDTHILHTSMCIGSHCHCSFPFKFRCLAIVVVVACSYFGFWYPSRLRSRSLLLSLPANFVWFAIQPYNKEGLTKFPYISTIKLFPGSKQTHKTVCKVMQVKFTGCVYSNEKINNKIETIFRISRQTLDYYFMCACYLQYFVCV